MVFDNRLPQKVQILRNHLLCLPRSEDFGFHRFSPNEKTLIFRAEISKRQAGLSINFRFRASLTHLKISIPKNAFFSASEMYFRALSLTKLTNLSIELARAQTIDPRFLTLHILLKVDFNLKGMYDILLIEVNFK